MRMLPVLLLVVGLCLAGPALAQNASQGGKPSGPRPVPVVEAVASQETIPLLLTAVGAVEAASTVEIKARITGELMQVHFAEGQEVKKGDVLFTLDPRPFEAALKESQARLERNQALVRKAEDDNRRYEGLAQKGIISREQFEEKFTNLAALQAQIKADEAAVESARIQLSYTVIRSPLDGRAGQILLHAGNMIKANDIAMVVLQQMRPIHVRFAVPEARLGEIMPQFAAGARLEVRAAPPGRETDPDKGALVFIDNSVDRKTGAIAMKGSFENRERRLWPGQFVNVALVLGQRESAVLIPSQAVMPSTQGEAVFVIATSNAVEFRPVKTGELMGDRVEIRSGLAAGERVVVDGQLRLAPGSLVEVKQPGGKPANAKAAATATNAPANATGARQ